MRTPVSFVLGKAHLLVPDAVCLVPRVLCQPYEKRIKGDRTILVGIRPRKVEFRFASRNIWAEATPGQSTFCRAAKWNVNEIRGTGRTKLAQESCGSYRIVPVVAQRYTPVDGIISSICSPRLDLVSL